MRKLKLQMHLSLDGFAATQESGPVNDIYWDDEIRNYCLSNLDDVDLVLLGHTTAADFIPYWADIAQKPDDPQFKIGRRLTEIPKLVFSKAEMASKWLNTTMSTDLSETVNKLKLQSGKNMLSYGGVSFVASLISTGLVDMYDFLVEPVGLGTGMPIFKQLTKLQLIKTVPFACGIVLGKYVPSVESV